MEVSRTQWMPLAEGRIVFRRSGERKEMGDKPGKSKDPLLKGAADYMCYNPKGLYPFKWTKAAGEAPHRGRK